MKSDLAYKYIMNEKFNNLCKKINSECPLLPFKSKIDYSCLLSADNINQTGIYMMFDKNKYQFCYVYIFTTGKNEFTEIIPTKIFNSDYIGYKYLNSDIIHKINDMSLDIFYLKKNKVNTIFILKSNSSYYFKPIQMCTFVDSNSFDYAMLHTSEKDYGFNNNNFIDAYNFQTFNKDELNQLTHNYNKNKNNIVYGDFYSVGVPTGDKVIDDCYQILDRNNEKYILSVGTKIPVEYQTLNYVSELFSKKLNAEKHRNVTDNKIIDEVLNNVVNKKIYTDNERLSNSLSNIAKEILNIKSLRGRQKLRKGTVVYFNYHYYMYLGIKDSRCDWLVLDNSLKMLDNYNLFESLTIGFKQSNDICEINFSEVLSNGIQIMVIDSADFKE